MAWATMPGTSAAASAPPVGDHIRHRDTAAIDMFRDAPTVSQICAKPLLELLTGSFKIWLFPSAMTIFHVDPLFPLGNHAHCTKKRLRIAVYIDVTREGLMV